MFKYYLCFGLAKIFLFESQFQFFDEAQCLRHYEKGLAKGLFNFDRARINQVWSELALWGLIGRICPVELVRVLCAFGCELQTAGCRNLYLPLRKSFHSVTYFVPASAADHLSVRHFHQWPLETNSTEHIPVLLELDDRLVLGSYYFTAESDVDSQLPKLCKLLEDDLCLPKDSLRISLFRFFESGFQITAQSKNDLALLAHLDPESKTIRGFNADNTLFYLGVFSNVA